ncbi:hypothetical protein B4W74_05110 [Staphylococcus intermedius]|uniref:Uncharacterized protein n=1 Tax=Staphylococcus intermedius NCTC 11048 TaxID=1141106 RepID=A0A380G8A5_STAIN|nr:hypothetical protein B5C04_04760 [Staphylococcus intermedius]PNZ54304.1 hypothetical protein CD138_03290 [Staphylococcus intermedius NCTC 11048]PCF81044.1 hypothetical protein B4W74_05110 [Staphylococcus intermedius]PCF82326.1 hypothetical protein B4W70_04755 [Staphylococcus intermedius]PCF87026.1 hypothetical protein B4W75_08025 [Staphylococcus intermedius]
MRKLIFTNLILTLLLFLVYVFFQGFSATAIQVAVGFLDLLLLRDVVISLFKRRKREKDET